MHAVLALTVALVANSTAPYVRSHTSKATGAHCLWWGDSTIAWSQNVVGNPATGSSVFGAVSTAFATWQGVMTRCGNLNFSEGARNNSRKTGLDPSGANINNVLFRYSTCAKKVKASDACWAAGTCSNDYDCWDHPTALLAVTVVSYDPVSGRIIDADIEFDAADNVFTTVDLPVCSTKALQTCVASDVQNTMTHEIGHLLGLDHTDAPRSTMNATASLGETSKRVLDTGTSAYVCDVYTKGFGTKDCVIDAASDSLGEATTATGCSAAPLGWWPLLSVLVIALRRRRASASGVVLSLLLVVGWAPAAHATTLAAMDLLALTSASDVVVHAHVREVSVRWSADHSRLFTEVTLERVEGWKGAPPVLLTVRIPGGQLEGAGQYIAGAPRLEVGDETVAFLERRGPGFVFTGFEQGVFHVDRSGSVTMARQRGGDALYVDLATRTAVDKQPFSFTLAALREAVTGFALQSHEGSAISTP